MATAAGVAVVFAVVVALVAFDLFEALVLLDALVVAFVLFARWP